MREQRLFWHLLVAAIGPFVAISVYLLATRCLLDAATDNSDFAAIAAAVFVSVVCMATMPAGSLARILAIFAAVPVLSVALFYYLFLFVGMVFGHWL